MDSLPLRALLPLQPPDAVQLEALAEFQVIVDVPPDATAVGLAASDTVGGGVGGVSLNPLEPPDPPQAADKLENTRIARSARIPNPG